METILIISILLFCSCTSLTQPDIPEDMTLIKFESNGQHITIKAKDNSGVFFIYANDTLPLPLDTLLKYYYLTLKKKQDGNH